MSLFEELKRRNVVRVAVLYVVAGWIVLQVADVLFEQLGVPGWAFRLVLGLLILGFPVVLIFSWVFELTPEGLKRERDIDRDRSITQQTGRKINLTIVILLVVAIAGLVADRLIPERPSPAQATVDSGAADQDASPVRDAELGADRLSIAVLPFVNMSGDPENEYFSDGLSEELLNTLVQIRELRVTGRTSSFAFKDQALDLREIGERLNVANVLEGSVRKAANRVRITAQLVKTTDGYHLWSETFDRELDDIFAIQLEIAEKVAQALSLTLLGEAARTAGETENAEAYQAYLRGLHVFRRAPDDPDSLETARSYFEQALELDPEYIAPWDGLYQYWQRRLRNGIGSLDANRAELAALADKLDTLAPESEEALNAQAGVSVIKRNWSRGLALLDEARQRYPGSVETNSRYGTLLFQVNRKEQGLAVVRDAVKLDPLSLEALSRLGSIENQMGNCEEERQISDRALEIEPGFGRVRGYVGLCLLVTNADPNLALAWLEQEPIGFLRRTGNAIAWHRLGQNEQAKSELESMIEDYGDTASYQYAQVYAQWGEIDLALDWLQTAVDVGDPGTSNMATDPLLDPIRQDPRFPLLMQQVGLAGCCELNPR